MKIERISMTLTEVRHTCGAQPEDSALDWDIATPVGALPASAQLKFVCQDCGRHRNEVTRYLVGQGRFGGITLEKLEGVIQCCNARCGGATRIEPLSTSPEALGKQSAGSRMLRFAS